MARLWAALAGTLALGVWAAGCGPHRTILDPPAGSGPAAAGPRVGPVQLGVLKSEAESWLGTPYRLGGNGRDGVDCSGFVRNVYAVLGIEVPRTVETLYEAGQPVPQRKLRLGDLVFFRFKGRRGPTHVGIYLGEGRFIHASIHGGVRVDGLEEGEYGEKFVGSRRFFA
jgi:cell wall-associated NlpC family hydrolase